MGKDVIVALDFDSKEKTLAFLDRFTEEKPFVKIGMELFYAEGPSIVREIHAATSATLSSPASTTCRSCRSSWTMTTVLPSRPTDRKSVV